MKLTITINNLFTWNDHDTWHIFAICVTFVCFGHNWSWFLGYNNNVQGSCQLLLVLLRCSHVNIINGKNEVRMFHNTSNLDIQVTNNDQNSSDFSSLLHDLCECHFFLFVKFEAFEVCAVHTHMLFKILYISSRIRAVVALHLRAML